MKNNKIIIDSNATLDVLKNKRIAIIGYGNQGRAQALNLKDSNLDVIIGLRDNSESKKKVHKDGLRSKVINQAVLECDIVSILISDKHIASTWKEFILPNLRANQTILFSHGYNVHYKLIDIPDNINVIMVAPSGGGK